MKRHDLALSLFSFFMVPVAFAQTSEASRGENPSHSQQEIEEQKLREEAEAKLLKILKEVIRTGLEPAALNVTFQDGNTEDDNDSESDVDSNESDSDEDYTPTTPTINTDTDDDIRTVDSDESSDDEKEEGKATPPLTPRKRTAPPESFEIILSPAKAPKKSYVGGDNHEGLSLENDWIGEIPVMIQHLLAYYQDEERFLELGAEMPKAFMFAGPPGVGKTYLAKILSSELDYPLTYITGPSLKSKWVGGSKDNVKKVFAEARQRATRHKRAMIFIDEIDAVGSRDEDSGNKMSTRELINQLLAEVDGFHASKILLFAATNHISSIDSALLRSGRFQTVPFTLPTDATRQELFSFYARRLKVQDFDALENHFESKMLKDTAGLSSADFKALCNQAALFAGFERADYVEIRHFEKALNMIVDKFKKKDELPSNISHLYM